MKVARMVLIALAFVIAATGCGTTVGDSEGEPDPVTAPSSASTPATSSDGDPDETPDDQVEEVLDGGWLGDEERPDWFPDIPIPDEINKFIGGQPLGAGQYVLSALMPVGTDPDRAVVDYAHVLGKDGWTVQVLDPDARPDNMWGLEASQDSRKLAFLIKLNQFESVQVEIHLSGFDS